MFIVELYSAPAWNTIITATENILVFFGINNVEKKTECFYDHECEATVLTYLLISFLFVSKNFGILTQFTIANHLFRACLNYYWISFYSCCSHLCILLHKKKAILKYSSSGGKARRVHVKYIRSCSRIICLPFVSNAQHWSKGLKGQGS